MSFLLDYWAAPVFNPKQLLTTSLMQFRQRCTLKMSNNKKNKTKPCWITSAFNYIKNILILFLLILFLYLQNSHYVVFSLLIFGKTLKAETPLMKERAYSWLLASDKFSSDIKKCHILHTIKNTYRPLFKYYFFYVSFEWVTWKSLLYN